MARLSVVTAGAQQTPLVFAFRCPIASWAGSPDEAPDLLSALRALANYMTFAHRDTARLWAAHPEEEYPEHPYRAQAMGDVLLFRTGSRTLHVVGDTQLAAETRQALTGGAVPGWDLRPVGTPATPLHALQPLLTTRCYRLLARYGFPTVEDVEATPDLGLLALGGAGTKFVDAVRTAITDLGLHSARITASAPAEDSAGRRTLIAGQLEPGPALRDRDFAELLARSSIPATGLWLITDALNAEPRPPAAPAVIALLDTRGENDLLDHYTGSRGAPQPRSRPALEDQDLPDRLETAGQ